MLNWIWQNRQWLFSGAGLSAILIGGGWIYQRFLKTGNLILPANALVGTGATSSSKVPGQFDQKLTPTEIRKRISNLPPYQQKRAAQDYEGINVSWSLEFVSIEEVWERGWRATFQYTEPGINGWQLVACDNVKIDANPKLKIARGVKWLA